MNGSELVVILVIISVFISILKKGLNVKTIGEVPLGEEDNGIFEDTELPVDDANFVLPEKDYIPAEDAVLESEAEEHFKETPVQDFQFHKAEYHTDSDEQVPSKKPMIPESEDFSPHGVRQAFIMKEILSPPLSKRSHSLNRHRS